MEKKSLKCNLEIWGGIESTINRVGDEYIDQLQLTGHYSRPEDIDHLVSLGIKKIRYPVLWEHHQPMKDQPIDWRWITRQLEALRSNYVEPIAGLVHHGSGPKHTSLLDPQFADGLANYAQAVARQFPWLKYYTPVNEPLTTARFSGLYGIWYPHSRDNRAFLRMLFNELRGVVLAMKEIRKITPDAKLVQTEDLGKTFSSPTLQYQADFENQRRWLSYDLLCGKVYRKHPLWQYLIWSGLEEKELMFFYDNPCPPDIAGFNYYPTSERYLDENLSLYSENKWGGNGRHSYVDTEAIRVDHQQPSGLLILLQEAWDRYKIPMAVTEAFLSCTPDEQVRWLHGMVVQCQKLADSGIDLKAITFWALLGEQSWNTLVTTVKGEYEAGAFDVRDGEIKPTLIAEYIKSLTGESKFDNEVLNGLGWWQRDDRFLAKQIACYTE